MRPYLPFSPPLQQAGLPPVIPGSLRCYPRPSLATELSFDASELSMDAGAGGSGEVARTRYGVEIEEEDDVLEEDTFQLAKTYYDIREHDRVVAVLQGCRGPRARFLKIYSAFLVSPSQRSSS